MMRSARSRVLSRLMREWRLATASMLLIAALGVYMLAGSGAAVFIVPAEAESGRLGGNAARLADGSASDGQAVKFGGGTAPVPTPTPSPAGMAGVFISRADLARMKSRATGSEPFRSSYNLQKGRADNLLSSTPKPFYMEHNDYLANIKYQWCNPDNDGIDNSLSEAVAKLEREGDSVRTLAMQYALTGDRRYGDKAMEYFRAWANRSTPVNMYDFYAQTSPFDAKLRGMTGEFCSNRPWNFALDGLFQGYGLINFADAYVLLTANGYGLSAQDDSLTRRYLLRLTEAVNSSFHAWTRWADAHPSSSSYSRYRYDNHLSWGLAPLLAASVALKDDSLAQYVLAGGSWTDSRAGAYKNPSHIRTLLDRSILADGRIIDPVEFGREEGYTYFHLWPMQLVARMGELHHSQDLWHYRGADGAGLEKAYDTAATKVISGEFGNQAWQYELVYNEWQTARNQSARDKTGRQAFVLQSYGPVVLLFGQ